MASNRATLARRVRAGDHADDEHVLATGQVEGESARRRRSGGLNHAHVSLTLPASGRPMPPTHAQECGLAGAVASDDPQHPTRGDAEADVLEDVVTCSAGRRWRTPEMAACLNVRAGRDGSAGTLLAQAICDGQRSPTS